MTLILNVKTHRSPTDYEEIKDAIEGDTFLITDNDGEKWVVLVTHLADAKYVCLCSSENNYSVGSVFKDWNEMLEQLDDYRGVAEKADFTVSVND